MILSGCGVQCFKPGVTPDAILAFGGSLARYREQYTVIVLPIRSYETPTAQPVGAVLFNTSGGDLPIFQAGGDTVWAKMKTTAGSESGWISPASTFPLPGDVASWQRAIKCEGVSDALAIYSAMTPDQRAAITVLTNASGSNEHPPMAALGFFRGKRVDVIHDADRPGQYGATGDAKYAPTDSGRQKTGWAGAIAREASECRNVELPYEIQEKHGKDIRDYFADGKSFNDLIALADAVSPMSASEILANEAVDDPHRLARHYIERHCTDHATGLRTIVFWRGEFHVWRDRRYQRMADKEIKSALNRCIKQEFDKWNIAEQADSTKTIPECRKVTGRLINDTMLALESLVTADGAREQPHWLTDDGSGWKADEIFSLANGNLHLPSIKADLSHDECLRPSTPALFSPTSVSYAFDHDPPPPKQWLAFLKSIWPNDQESINCLQEWFGYCLLPDTRHHKMLMIVGVKRSGKGTIVEVLENLIGSENVIGPKLSTLEKASGRWWVRRSRLLPMLACRGVPTRCRS